MQKDFCLIPVHWKTKTRQKSGQQVYSSGQVVKDFRSVKRKRQASEEKSRTVGDELVSEYRIGGLCRRLLNICGRTMLRDDLDM